MPGASARPSVVIGRVHAEPDAEQPTIRDGDCWWLALWEDGTVTRHSSALALLREV